MKRASVLLLILIAACQPEKLTLRSNIRDIEAARFTPGQTVALEAETNGSPVMVTHEGKVISEGDYFTLDESFEYGSNGLEIYTFNEVDTLRYPFKITVVPSNPPRSLQYEVVATYPHPTSLFTQGFILDGEYILESSGQRGQSALSVYKLGSDRILQQIPTSTDWFAEGLTLLGDSLYQITWTSEKGMTYHWDGQSITPGRVFEYRGREGWGLTTLDNRLLWSDGTDLLRWVDPNDFSVVQTKKAVTAEGFLSNLNELEIYRNRVAVNLWRTDRIVFLNPENGVGEYVLDLDPIAETHRVSGTLNGIAVKGDNLLITGKNWPLIYEIRVDAF